jgi:hypothetical protein
MIRMAIRIGANDQMILQYEITARGPRFQQFTLSGGLQSESKLIEGVPLEPAPLFQLLLSQGLDWELDLSAATGEERRHWGAADCATRIGRAFQQSRPVIFEGQEYSDDESLFREIEATGKLVQLVSDDEEGLVLAATDYMH